MSSALSTSKISVPFTLADIVDMREDINQVVIGGERKGTRNIGCEQFVINANNKNGKKSNSSTIMSKISSRFKNLNIKRGPSYLASPLVVRNLLIINRIFYFL